MLFSEAPVQPPPAQRAGVSGFVTSFQYRPTVQEQEIAESAEAHEVAEPEIRCTEEGFARRLAEERALGAAEAEIRLKRGHEQQLTQEREKIAEGLRAFEKTRREYFAEVEAEVVQLALSIARKILHREVQVDPLLMTALVGIALGQIKEGSAVTARVWPGEAHRWREQLRAPLVNVEVTVVEDSDRQPGDCVLETEMGSVNFSLDAQLKEVERGFLDVLARTPQR